MLTDKIEKERVTLEIEKLKTQDEKVQLLEKIEAEVKTRIMFEQKLNSLHLVNMDADSRATFYKEKLERLEVVFS